MVVHTSSEARDCPKRLLSSERLAQPATRNNPPPQPPPQPPWPHPLQPPMVHDHTQTTEQLKTLVKAGKVKAQLPAELDDELGTELSLAPACALARHGRRRAPLVAIGIGRSHRQRRVLLANRR